MHGDEARRVLVADDNADAADTLASLLEMLGLDVVVARDGAQAVEAARARLPDVAILDLGMPGLNGWEACRAIRALPGGARVRVIALSGWGAPPEREKSARAGFEAHWTKPAEASKLLDAIANKR